MKTPRFDSIHPQHCVNAKLRRLHRLLDGIYQERMRPFGLIGSMLSIMFIIGKNPGINQKDIAEKLVLTPSTMSRDVKKLQKKGWVSIEKGSDSRASELYITDEGYELLEEVSPVWEDIQQKVTELLGAFNLQQIDAITTAISSNKSKLNI